MTEKKYFHPSPNNKNKQRQATTTSKYVATENRLWLRPRPQPETLGLVLPSGGLPRPWFSAQGCPPHSAPRWPQLGPNGPKTAPNGSGLRRGVFGLGPRRFVAHWRCMARSQGAAAHRCAPSAACLGSLVAVFGANVRKRAKAKKWPGISGWTAQIAVPRASFLAPEKIFDQIWSLLGQMSDVGNKKCRKRKKKRLRTTFSAAQRRFESRQFNPPNPKDQGSLYALRAPFLALPDEIDRGSGTMKITMKPMKITLKS